MRDVLDLTDLHGVEGEPIGTLSHGFRQRVGVAQAIIHGPKFLILDEPTRGLDPVQIVEMRKLIHDLKEKHTVLISSHILTEISQTCDRLLVLGRGRVLGVGTEGELAGKESEIRTVTATVRPPSGDPFRIDPKGQITQILKGVDGVTEVGEPMAQGGGYQFTVTTSKDCRDDPRRAGKRGEFMGALGGTQQSWPRPARDLAVCRLDGLRVVHRHTSSEYGVCLNVTPSRAARPPMRLAAA